MIEVDVEKRIGAFQMTVRFDAQETGITALFGRSGAGKTMLVNMLAGLMRPDRGRIVVQGEVLFSTDQRIDLPPERRRLGYVFQEGRLFPHYSVRGNLAYGMHRTASDSAITLDAVVALLGLEPLLDRRPGDLSGGEKQRVGIGRALLAHPRLLLMDEPLAALDLPRKAEIMPFIERLRDELHIPIVYVTHAMEEIVRLADRLVLLSEGQVAAVGTVEELTSRLDLRPLTGRYEAGAVIRTTLAGHDVTFGLSELAFPGGRLRVAHVPLPLGTPLRARIRARDVALATARPAGISIRNIFRGRIIEIGPDRGPIVDIRIDIGTAEAPVILWSRITLRAAQELDLVIGREIFALVKTVALDRASFGRFGSSGGIEDEDST
ncbi:MAG TPA: molybdenum ABC transporter ATP-binding protein [Stellaceae bacterium]|nr:molybdenum ABC transporter ATP-binding protein [Stellaceae bacterium]